MTRRHNGSGNSSDTPAALAVSPAGNGVFVTGTCAASDHYDYLTVVYQG